MTTMFESLRNPIVSKTLWLIGGLLLIMPVYLAVVTMTCRKSHEEIRGMLRNYVAWLFILPVGLIPLLAGNGPWIVLILILSLICFREYGRATGLWRDQFFVWIGAACIAGIYYPVVVRWYGLFLVMPIYTILILLTVPLARDAFERMTQRTCLAILGVLYFGWSFSHVAYLVHIENGIGHLLFVLSLTELNDIFAYNIGKVFGKHRLSPRISPNKTVEGSLGALAAVIGFAFVLRYAVPEYSTFHLMMIAALISMTGTFGDLSISFIKRDFGLKDMGRVIPGQGGVLDRLDSLIFVAPVFFHFTVYFYPWLHHAQILPR